MNASKLGHVLKKPVFFVVFENEEQRVYKFIKKGKGKYYVLCKDKGDLHPQRVAYNLLSTQEALMMGDEINEEEYLNY